MDNSVTINDLYRDELNPKLYDLVLELKNSINLKGNLKITIIDDQSYQPNAFGVNFLEYGQIEITRGIFKKIDIDSNSNELRFLLLHEMCHILNKDSTWYKIFISVWIVSFIVALCAFIQAFIQAIIGSFLNSISLVLLSILVLIFEGELFYWWRRRVEFRCDSFAVNITRNPVAAKSFLEKRHVDYETIKDKIHWRKKPKIIAKRKFDEFFLGSHPKIEKRIENIEKIIFS